MTYRDDREALHHRVAQLEEELRDARREGEEHGRDEAQAKAKALEDKLADMRGELAKMTAELDALRGGKPRTSPRNGVILALVAVALGLFAAGAIFAFARTQSTTSTVVPIDPGPQVPPLPYTSTPVAPPTPAAAPIPLEPILGPARSTTARWTATVTRAEGLALGAGSQCTVDATISTKDTNALVPNLEITCGSQTLYRSSDRLNGMSQRYNDAREVLGPSDDKSTFTLLYRDIGARTGERAQLDLDSTHRQASVFRETIPRFRVDLSLPTTSAPTAPLSAADQRMRRTGKVNQVTGTTPVKGGASCVLRAMATGKGTDCAAEVSCGGTTVWPSSAPAKCTYEASKAVTVTASEGGTTLAMAGPALTVKTKTATMEITLDDP